MEALRVTAKFGKDGKLELPALTGEPGKSVEVIVLFPEKGANLATRSKESMRGSVLRYDDPFGPATDLDDWDALRDDTD